MKRTTEIMCALTAVGCMAALPAAASDYGNFTLKAGELQEIHIGSTYRDLRVCNDFGSAGGVVVTIGDHDPHALQPGLCAEGFGGSIKVLNQANGVAMGIYRMLQEPVFGQ
jgi:hypothetical protein